MKISLEWLSDFIDWKITDSQQIADSVTAHIAEVDAVAEQGALLDRCVVGKILSLRKHPGADKLSLCDVQTDQGVKKVVCGGSNLREGMRVALAHVGARVKWHGGDLMTLERTKIRGEESEGMICAGEELDLAALFPASGERDIIDLGDGDEGVGRSLCDYLGLGGAVLHIDNHAITHRPDLFSHRGFARECVAIGIAAWKKKIKDKKPRFSEQPLPFEIHADAIALVPRYAGCLLTIRNCGTTPDWMKRRLEATGWRSINLPIDITNYVLMETGMPLHAFDADDLRGDIRIRTAKKGEKIRTLDDVERSLPEGALVISDDAGIFDLLGIMGGLRSSTKDSTRSIYLHAAIVDGMTVRRAVIATGHRTDAATVYEKGVPPVAAMQGLSRAIELFQELIPGAKIASALHEWGEDGSPKTIELPLSCVHSTLGADVPEKEVQRILTDLGCSVKKKSVKRQSGFAVAPPLWRTGDISGPHDLIEEIGRVYGYNNIAPRFPDASIAPPARDHRLSDLRDALKEEGFFELLPLSLTGPRLLERAGFDPSHCITVQNALGEEVSLLQPSTLPSLLEHAEEFLRDGPPILSTFTIGRVFSKGSEEVMELGMLVITKKKQGLLHDPFLIASSALTHALGAAGGCITLQTAAQVPPHAHPGRAADIMLSGRRIGTLCEVHPLLRDRFSLPDRAAVCLLSLTEFLGTSVAPTLAAPPPAFPAVSYDETILLSHTQESCGLIQQARAASDILERIDIVDLYDGSGVPVGQYRCTIRCSYRAPDRTLTEQEAKEAHAAVIRTFQ